MLLVTNWWSWRSNSLRALGKVALEAEFQNAHSVLGVTNAMAALNLGL